MTDTAATALSAAGVFKGADGLERLANAQEFWDEQPYGTRLYFGPGGSDYLHRGVLQAAVEILRAGRGQESAHTKPEGQ